MAKRKMSQGDIGLDMTPMIDMVFLLIIFFILAGRISSELRAESITVPPSKTAEEFNKDKEKGWQNIVVEAFGTTQSVPAGEPACRLRVQGEPNQGVWSRGLDDMTAYIFLRDKMDEIYRHAEDWKVQDKLKLKKVVVEVRADMDTEYRVVQEILQVLSDTIDPRSTPAMLPKKAMPEDLRPFVNLRFTTRNPNDKTK